MESTAFARAAGPPRSKSQYQREKITILESHIEKPDHNNFAGEVMEPSTIFPTNKIADAVLESIMKEFRTKARVRCGTWGNPNFFGAIKTIEVRRTASTKQKTLWWGIASDLGMKNWSAITDSTTRRIGPRFSCSCSRSQCGCGISGKVTLWGYSAVMHETLTCLKWRLGKE